MRATYLGHSTYLVETRQGVRILIDPVITDRFQAGFAEVFPAREIDFNRLFPVDLVILTHSHPGHLELESLSLIDRNTPIVHMTDPTVLTALENLGFNERSPIEWNDVMSIDDVEILFTPSAHGRREVGIVFKTSSGVIWHMVDSEPSSREIEAIKEWAGRIDFLIWNYPGNNHRFFTQMSTAFPHTKHAEFLLTLRQIQPTMLYVNLSGFRYHGKNSWVNNFMFPVDVELLNDQLPEVLPQAKYVALLPGDVIQFVDLDREIVQRGASSLVQSIQLEDEYGQIFDPTNGVPPLEDSNPENLPPRVLQECVDQFVTSKFLPWLHVKVQDKTHPIFEYGQLNLRFGLTVHYPDKSVEHRLIKINKNAVELTNSFELPPAQMRMRITASGLHRWAEGVIPYYAAYFETRSHSTLHRVLTSIRDKHCSVNDLSPSRYMTGDTVLDGRDPISIYMNESVDRTFNKWIRTQAKSLAEIVQ